MKKEETNVETLKEIKTPLLFNNDNQKTTVLRNILDFSSA